MRIEHYGYLGAVRDSREKSRRNIELLRLQQAESPPTPFLHYNLGSEYAAAGRTARPRSPSSSAPGSCCRAFPIATATSSRRR